ncbi:MAG: TIGR02678 family protein [Limnochordia bacterium]|jgi:uncharacterized protein (TIGR02678 family)
MRNVRTSDQQRPFIDLLDRVSVSAGDDMLAYRRIRLNLSKIRDWFADRTGWAVMCNRELARLVKTPSLLSVGHGFTWTQQPLDYELFAWVLWFSESSGADQFLLSQLVEEIEVRANELCGSGHVDWDIHAHRLSLNRALKGLEQYGILRRLDGDTEGWLRDRQSDSLYEFTPLTRHIHVDLLPEYQQTPFPQTEEGRASASLAMAEIAAVTGQLSDMAPIINARTTGAVQQHSPLLGCGPAGQRLYRTLLLSPALYACADPEAFSILQGRDRRRSIAEDLQATLGWDLEVTASYACLLRPSASEASGQTLFPFQGGLAHVILLLCGRLHEQVASGTLIPDPYDRLRITPGQLSAFLAELRGEYGQQWGRTLRELGIQALTRQVMETMATWDLMAGPDCDGQLYVLPLAARFRGTYSVEGEQA